MVKIDLEPLPDNDDLAIIGAFWGLEQPQFVRKMENIVYSCNKNGKKVYLRLTSLQRRSRDQIQAELEWIEFLGREHISVVQPLHDVNGDLTATVFVRGQQFEACVFREIVGAHPTEQILLDKKFLFDLGKLLAKMHQASIKYCGGEAREHWYEERGLRHAREAMAITKNEALKEYFEKIIEWMNNLSISRDNYGLIHADCGPSNLLIQPDGTISVIDFDDSCFHWFAFDIAFVIYSIALNSNHEQFDETEDAWLQNLLMGYRSVRLFSDSEEKLIPRFVDFACLRIIFWIEYHENLDTFRDEVLLHVKMVKEWAIKRVSCDPQL